MGPNEIYDQLRTLICSITQAHNKKPDLMVSSEVASIYNALVEEARTVLPNETRFKILPELSSQSTVAGALASSEQFQLILAKHCSLENDIVGFSW